MRRRTFAAFVLFAALMVLVGAFGTATHRVEPSVREARDDVASAAVSTLTRATLAAPAKVTSSVHELALLGASVGLLLIVRFAKCETIVAWPVVRARAIRRRRAPPWLVI